jgi:hypothetical protein
MSYIADWFCSASGFPGVSTIHSNLIKAAASFGSASCLFFCPHLVCRKSWQVLPVVPVVGLRVRLRLNDVFCLFDEMSSDSFGSVSLAGPSSSPDSAGMLLMS